MRPCLPIFPSRIPLLALAIFAASVSGRAEAHPHVFVDGGVDVVFGEENVVEALEVTWLHDAFETLYTLSSHGISLNDEGGLDEGDRRELISRLEDWPDDFDGSAHLSVDGANVALDWPEDLDVRLRDGRLEMTFTRRLGTPLDLEGRSAEIGFYERTYFFAFSVTNAPRLIGGGEGCTARVVPFEPDAESDEIRALLSSLGREETPQMGNVGARLADRIEVTCG